MHQVIGALFNQVIQIQYNLQCYPEQ